MFRVAQSVDLSPCKTSNFQTFLNTNVNYGFQIAKYINYTSFKPRLHEQLLCDNFNVTIFICPCKRAKLSNFWQMHLLKSWRVSFCETNENCHIRKIARVNYSSCTENVASVDN